MNAHTFNAPSPAAEPSVPATAQAPAAPFRLIRNAREALVLLHVLGNELSPEHIAEFLDDPIFKSPTTLDEPESQALIASLKHALAIREHFRQLKRDQEARAAALAEIGRAHV